MITTVSDMGAQAATKPVVALAYLAVVRRLAGCSDTPPGFGHRTPHFGVLSSGPRFFTFPVLHDPVLSIALALFGQTLAFVCMLLALVGRLLTIGGDPVPLVGDPVSLKDVLPRSRSARRGQIWGGRPMFSRPKSTTIRR
jgi:hypothetical protein